MCMRMRVEGAVENAKDESERQIEKGKRNHKRCEAKNANLTVMR